MPHTFRSLQAGDLDALRQIQQRYVQANPGVAAPPVEMYLSPYFGEGQRVRVALDEAGNLAAYAPFFPQAEVAWVEIRAEGQQADAARGVLWDWLVEQARAGGQRWLNFQYLPCETANTAYVEERGARRAYSIYNMLCPLQGALPDCALPDGYTLRRWRMDSLAEQQVYLAARNACFPEAPTRLEEWQFFANSPYWAQGSNVAAFSHSELVADQLAKGELVASVLVFWEPGSPVGSTEYVFTLPEHRGKGLSRALLAEGMRYLQEHGLESAALEVKAENETALRLYLSLGYTVVRESRVYQYQVKPV